MAVTGGVFDYVFFVLSFFLLDVLDEIWDFTVSVSEGFLTYSLRLGWYFCCGSSVLHVVVPVCIWSPVVCHLYSSCPLCFLFGSVL